MCHCVNMSNFLGGFWNAQQWWMISVLKSSIYVVVVKSLSRVWIFCDPIWLSRLLCPRDFRGKNTGEGCHFLLQGTFLTQGSNPCLLHWQAGSLPLSHQGSPLSMSVCPNISSQVSATDLSRFSYFRLWVLASSGPSCGLRDHSVAPTFQECCLHSFHLPLGFSKSLSGVLQEVEFRASSPETSQTLFLITALLPLSLLSHTLGEYFLSEVWQASMFLQLELKQLEHKSQIHGFLLLSTCSHSSLEVTSTGFDLTAGKKKENIRR